MNQSPAPTPQSAAAKAAEEILQHIPWGAAATKPTIQAIIERHCQPAPQPPAVAPTESLERHAAELAQIVRSSESTILHLCGCSEDGLTPAQIEERKRDANGKVVAYLSSHFPSQAVAVAATGQAWMEANLKEIHSFGYDAADKIARAYGLERPWIVEVIKQEMRGLLTAVSAPPQASAKELVSALERADKLITRMHCEVHRKELTDHLAYGFKEDVIAASAHDALGIRAALARHSAPSATAKSNEGGAHEMWAVLFDGKIEDARPSKKGAEAYATGFSNPDRITIVHGSFTAMSAQGGADKGGGA